MALLAATMMTLADRIKREDPDGQIGVIIEILSQLNQMNQDIPWLECNDGTSHRARQRTGLPEGTWRKYNQGVAPTKSQVATISDECGMLEAYSIVDKALADLNGNAPQFRMSEDVAFLEGMSQQAAAAFIYSNAANTPQQIMGLAPRYSTVNTATANIAQNVIDCGGTGSDNTSLWLLCWGPRTIHGLYPKGSRLGLQMNDKGDVTPAYDGSNNRFEAYTTHFKWDMGISVPDWRYGVRACNIDVSDLLAGTGVNLINTMIRMIHRLPTQPASAGTEQESDAKDMGIAYSMCAFYANRTVRTYLDIQAANKANALLNIDQYAGKPRTTFLGIPVRTVDQILNTEDRIV
jgi:hypothetical protein